MAWAFSTKTLPLHVGPISSMLGLMFLAWGLRFMVWGLGLIGFRVWCFGSRVFVKENISCEAT